MTTSSPGTKLLFLLLPGMDWRLAQPLVDEDALPHLQSLIDRGTIGNLATAPPLRWPVPLLSAITGTLGDGHGLFSPFHPITSPGGEPGLSLFELCKLKAPLVWDVLARQGVSTAHIGWPGTFPLTAVEGLSGVSDMFAHAKGKSFADWPVDDGVLSPDLEKAEFEPLRLHPREVTPQMLLPFLDQAQSLDLETDERAGIIVSLLARLSTLHGAATYILEQRAPEVMAVHFDFLQHLSSLFVGYAAPKMPQVTDIDHALYGKVTQGAYRFFDMLLGRYIDLLPDDAHIVIASPHGMRLGDMRAAPRLDGSVDATSGYRPLGTLLACGPKVKRDDLITGAYVQDVAPTLLSLIGADVPKAMTGRVLTDLFVDAPVAERIDFAASPRGPAETQLPAQVSQYLAGEWQKLGLVRKLPDEADLAHEAVSVDIALSQATLYMARLSKQANEKAAAALERVLEIVPDHPDALVRLCQLALRRGDLDACETYLTELEDSGAAGVMATLLKAQAALAKKDNAAASEALTLAKQLADKLTRPIRLYDQIGNGWLKLNEADRAEEVFLDAHAIDPDDPMINAGLGFSLAMQKRDEEAVTAYQTSLAALYEQPGVHFSLGRALARLGKADQALKSFGTAIELNPKDERARRSFNALTKKMAQDVDVPA